MKTWLIHATENSVPRITKMDDEQQAIKFVGNVILGNHPGTSIENIYVVDVVAGTITALESSLEGLTLIFKVKA